MGMRGPTPTPTPLKILNGSVIRSPKKQPKPSGDIPKCPRFLGKVAKAKWRELAPQLSELGLLTAIDGAALSSLCVAWEEFIWACETLDKEGRTTATKTGYLMPHPAVAMQRTAWAAIQRFSNMFGLSPASRSCLRVEKQDKEASVMSRKRA